MSEFTLNAPSTKQSSRPTRKTLLTPQTMRTAADVLQVGLLLLEGNRKTRPYAQMIRVATTLGAAAMPDEQEKFLNRLKELRLAMQVLEQAPELTKEQKRQYSGLQQQVMGVLDLLLAGK